MDKKISQLTSATTPLTGTEELAIVQGGSTVKATAQDVADLGGGGGGIDQIFVEIGYMSNITGYGSPDTLINILRGQDNSQVNIICVLNIVRQSDGSYLVLNPPSTFYSLFMPA